MSSAWKAQHGSKNERTVYTWKRTLTTTDETETANCCKQAANQPVVIADKS